MELKSRRIEIADSLEEIYEYTCQQKWGDGLPVIPPTEERVERFIKQTGMEPSKVLGEIPPANGEATIEKVSVNAIMAGCLPEYMPVLVAAVEAMLEPEFNLHAIQCTTGPVAPIAVINGPIRHKLDINCGRGCLGPGWRSNATIGRAIRFILNNIGGAIPGEISKSIHGMSSRYTCCFGEDEEGNPWGPLHADRGFDREASTVTIFGVNSFVNNVTLTTKDPKDYLFLAANALATVGNTQMQEGEGEALVIITSGHAAALHQAGYTKKDCQRIVFENARAPLSALHGVRISGLEPRIVEGMLTPCERVEDIVIVVAGGDQAYHLQVGHSFGMTRSVTKVITPAGQRSSR